MLAGGPNCMCEMAVALGEGENTASSRLAKASEAGLVHGTRHASGGRSLESERGESACADAPWALADLLA